MGPDAAGRDGQLMRAECMGGHTLEFAATTKRPAHVRGTRGRRSCSEGGCSERVAELVRCGALCRRFRAWLQRDELWKPSFTDVSPPPDRRAMRAAGQRGDQLLELDRPRKGWRDGVRRVVVRRVRASGRAFAAQSKTQTAQEMLRGST